MKLQSSHQSLLTLSIFIFFGNSYLRAQDADPGAWARENFLAARYTEAVKRYREAFDKDPPGSKAWKELALETVRALAIVGDYQTAITICDRVLALEHDENLLCRKAELFLQVGRYQEAFKLLNESIERDPLHHRAWAMRKEVAKALGRKEIVQRTSDHFFDLFNNNAEHFNSAQADPLVLAYVGLGIQEENPKDAFEVGFMLATDLIEKRKLRETEPHLWTAQLAFEVYSFGEAGKYFTKALELQKDHPDALVGMAQVFMSQYNIPRAEPLLDQALKINPNHISGLLLKAEIAITEDRMEEAREQIDKALTVNPNHMEALAYLAFMHAWNMQPDEEAEIEKRAMAIFESPDFYCDIGELFEKKFGYEVCAKYYRKALQLDPDSWRGLYLLGMNTSRQGAHGEEEGKAMLLRAFSMNKFNVWASNMIRVLDKIVGDREQETPPVYSTSQTKHFTLKFHQKEAEIVRPYLEEWVEEAYAKQTKLFGFQPEGPLTITLCYNSGDQAARTVGVPIGGVLGVCFGKLSTVLSPREALQGNAFNWRRVMEHEFGHVMTLQLSAFRLPRWYTEGFSTYLEDDSRLNTDPMMLNAIRKKQLQKIEDMNQYFRGNILMAYVHGRYVVEYIAKTFGFDVHRKVLRGLAEGGKFTDLLVRHTGQPLEKLNEGQFGYIDRFFQQVRLQPAFDRADLATLETAAGKSEATAQDLADLAVAYGSLGQLERADAVAIEALTKDESNVDALAVLGALRYRKEDFHAAKKLFERVIELDKDRSFNAWHKLGLIYRKEGRVTKSIEALEYARKLYPRYSGPDNPHYVLPELYMESQPPVPAQAIAVWLDAIQLNTEDKEAAFRGLQLAMKLKDWNKATRFALAHIEIDPYKLEVHQLAGQAYEQLKDWERATREYYVGTQIDEKDLTCWLGLARVQHLRKNREAAANAVKAALEIDGTNKEAKALAKELGL